MPKVKKIEAGVNSIPALRVTERKGKQEGKKQKDPSIRVRCGCCAENVVIYYDTGNLFFPDNTLEINGVLGTVTQWRKVLLPLLGVEDPAPRV